MAGRHVVLSLREQLPGGRPRPAFALVLLLVNLLPWPVLSGVAWSADDVTMMPINPAAAAETIVGRYLTEGPKRFTKPTSLRDCDLDARLKGQVEIEVWRRLEWLPHRAERRVKEWLVQLQPDPGQVVSLPQLLKLPGDEGGGLEVSGLGDLPEESFTEQTMSGKAGGSAGWPKAEIGLELGLGLTVLEWSRYSVCRIPHVSRQITFCSGVSQRTMMIWLTFGPTDNGADLHRWATAVLCRGQEIGFGPDPVRHSGKWRFRWGKHALSRELAELEKRREQAWSSSEELHPKLIAFGAEG
ncbi:MAG: hypothetical protein ABFE08_21550 [Armatimonadia bacterium]